jgi:hypothetical protein
MIATITPLEALRRLISAVKLIDAADCKDERVWNQLGGELGVAEGVVRDYVESKPVGHINHYSSGSVGVSGQSMLSLPHGAPLYAGPVAAQPSEVAQPSPELREVLRDSLASGLTGYMRECDLYPAADCNDLLDELCDLAIAVIGHRASPLPEAGSAAPAGEVERDAALNEAVAALYFNDNSKYEGALWNIVYQLSPSIHEILQIDPCSAYNATKE